MAWTQKTNPSDVQQLHLNSEAAPHVQKQVLPHAHELSDLWKKEQDLLVLGTTGTAG
jgi:hypothetical protein